MTRRWIGFVCVVGILLLAWGTTPALAQEEGLTLFTPFPVREVAIGEDVTLRLTLRTLSVAQTVYLEVDDLPSDWTATFRGGGDIIRAAYVEPESDVTIDLRLGLPAQIEPGPYRLSIVAEGESTETVLPVELIVQEKLPPSLEFQVELPILRGSPETTFRYSVELSNAGDQDLQVTLAAQAPPEFQVDFTLAGQDVTSIPLTANETKQLSVEAEAFTDVPAGSYNIELIAQGEEATATTDLTAEVTGQADLSISTPDGRLSGRANAGSETPLAIVVRNDGSAPARDIQLSSSAPSGWSVEFEPQQIAELPADQQVEVTARLTPGEQSVAGDYMVTLRANPQEGSPASAEFRITVLTSTLWGIVGLGLVAVAVIVVGLAVMRFGRR
jgi:uncharacterized membrane protein